MVLWFIIGAVAGMVFILALVGIIGTVEAQNNIEWSLGADPENNDTDMLTLESNKPADPELVSMITDTLRAYGEWKYAPREGTE